MTSVWDIVRLPLVEVCIVGALAGLVGVFAVLKQRVFFAESVTHGAFPGAVLGVVVGNAMFAQQLNSHELISSALFVGALLMCLPLTWLMYRISRIPGQSAQAAAGIVLTLGFALGYFLNTWFAPLPLKIESFLSGSVLNVNYLDIAAAALVLFAVLLVTAGYGRQLLFYCLDEQGFRALGLNAVAAELLILGMVVTTVVVVIPAVGTILSIALVAAPAAGLAPLLRSTTGIMIAAPVAGIGIGLLGMSIALWAQLSVGGTIAIVAGVFI